MCAFPRRIGIWQTVGDSVGPGGVFRSLRHVPELVAIARDMEELCPDAWLFNYTNPLTALVRAVQKTSPIKCAGLCHGVMHTRDAIAHDLGIPPAELSVTVAGLNHLGWVLDCAIRARMSTPASGSWSAAGSTSPPADVRRSLRGLPGSQRPADGDLWLLPLAGRSPRRRVLPLLPAPDTTATASATARNPASI